MTEHDLFNPDHKTGAASAAAAAAAVVVAAGAAVVAAAAVSVAVSATVLDCDVIRSSWHF